MKKIQQKSKEREMTITVTFKTFKYEPIIKYYNQNKPPDWNPIEKLNRLEGGFQIKMEDFDHNRSLDINQRIKQVRWHKQQLITPIAMFGFTVEEEYLLYQSFLHVHGENEVTKTPHKMKSISSPVTKFNHDINKVGCVTTNIQSPTFVRNPIYTNNDNDSEYTYDEESYSNTSYDESQDQLQEPEVNSSDDTIECNVQRLSLVNPSKIESYPMEPGCWV